MRIGRFCHVVGLGVATISSVLILGGCSGPAHMAGDGSLIVNYEAASIPGGVSASMNGLREITLVWDLAGPNVSMYRLERSDVPTGSFMEIETVDPRLLRYVDRGSPHAPLEDGVGYYYRIVSLLKSGAHSQPSMVVHGMTAPPPDPPATVTLSAPSSRAIRIRWTPPPSVGIVRYRLERVVASRPTEVIPVATLVETEYLDGGTVESVLADSTEYMYRVISINRVGAESEPRISAPLSTLPPPAAPTGLKAEALQVRCVPLTWNPNPEPDIVRYDVYRMDRKTGKYTRIGRTNGRTQTRYLDGGSNPGNLADNTTYSYRLRAVNAVLSESADTEAVEATTRAVPERVADVAAQADGPRLVVVTWPPSKDEAVIGYEVWCAEAGKDLVQVGHTGGKNTTRFVYRGDTSDPAGLGMLKDATEYTFRIVEFNTGYVRSSASAAVTARTKSLPAKPAGAKATTHIPHAVAIRWDANPESDIVHYVVERAATGGSFEELADVPAVPDAPVLYAKETGLDSGVTRQYRVKAVDIDRLESPWTEVIYGASKPIPHPPGKLAVAKAHGGTRVTWSPPPEKDIKEYVVWKKGRFTSWDAIGTSREREFVFLNNELEKPITIRVTSIDEDNLESQPSNSIVVQTL